MYRVEERLDQGGMGRVFRGTEIGTGESVAIKIILPEMAEDLRVAQMFRREARTLRQLHHDAIVRYFAYVPPDEFMDMHALVMGFIEGKKLSDKLKAEGPMVKDDVCQLFIRLADGLAQAHKIGVVHRDLSPDNVMLPENDINKAVLIDFGISRSSKIKDVTIGNEFAGKLKYVSPEQLGAYGGEADAPSDVYSFGLLMCACLMGKALPMGDSIVEAVQKRQGVPDLTEVPPSFQGLLYEMLQPDPAQRMQTMESVIDGLKSISGDGDMDRSFGPVTVAPSRTVPGLQAAPSAQQTTFMTSPPPLAEGQADAALAPAKGSVGLIAVLAVCACVAAGAGYYYFANAGSGDVAGTQEADDPLARVPDTLETYLAESVESECAFATLRAQGALAGRLTAISNGPQIGGSLVGNWPTAFGAAPDVAQFEVSDAQCAAVEFAHMFQGTRGASIEISVDQATVTRAEGVVGKITGSAERQNWLGLVAPNGRVFSLMSQLQAAIGTQRQFAFRLPSAQPGTYVLIATASDDALVRAGAMQDGTAAADIFPLMARELGADGNGALSISVLEITP
nr:serine/threonine-protein kinase [Nereida sp. MMG025]